MAEQDQHTACQALRVRAVKKMSYPLVNCPKCNHVFENVPDQEELNGRDFLIVFWLHRGFMIKDIVKAIGITTTTFYKCYNRVWGKYAQECGFFSCNRRKDGRKKLRWFYRGGILFDILQREEGPEREGDSCYDWDYRKALREGRKIITDLSDWQSSGFVFTPETETSRGEIFACEASDSKPTFIRPGR